MREPWARDHNPVLRRLRQEDLEVKVNLDFSVLRVKVSCLGIRQTIFGPLRSEMSPWMLSSKLYTFRRFLPGPQVVLIPRLEAPSGCTDSG